MISSVAEIKEDRDKVARETKVLQNYVLLTHLNVVLVWELTHTHTHTQTDDHTYVEMGNALVPRSSRK